jgi:hypothetical protein
MHATTRTSITTTPMPSSCALTSRDGDPAIEANAQAGHGSTPDTSPVPATVTPFAAKAAIITSLLAEPDREWTATQLAATLPASAVTDVNTASQLIYELMHDRLLEPVPFQAALTVRVVQRAGTALRLKRAEWQRRAKAAPARLPDRAVDTGQPVTAIEDRPRWQTSGGAEITLGDAIRIVITTATEAINAVALVTAVTEHDGHAVATILTGVMRHTTIAVRPGRDVTAVLRHQWQARNGELLRVGDTATLHLSGHGANPVGRIVDVTNEGDPIVFVCTDRLLNGHETALQPTSLLTKTTTLKLRSIP